MSSTKDEDNQIKINFVKNELIAKIMEANDDLKSQKLLSSTVNLSEHLDGFMSAILLVELVTESLENKSKTNHSIIVKLMKGDVAFRTTSKSYVQFSNEINVYANIIPTFKKFLGTSKSIDTDNWIPRIYFADYGLYPALSDGYESILVMENVKPLGFRSGPRLDLDEDHLLLMLKTLAEYHSLSYAMRIKKDPKLQELIDKVIPLNIQDPDGNRTIFDVIFGIGLDRFFNYLDRSPQHHEKNFMKDINNLKTNYGQKPVRLMQSIINPDDVYSLLVHGDFNRNNMLFKYPSEDGYDKPTEVKIIDFQEMRFSTPAIDISFCMFMNMTPELQEKCWDKFLKFYHDNLIKCLCDILKCDENDTVLEPYSFKNFNDHFINHAFYGAMIAIHFLPYMMCDEDECSRISFLFEKDMKSKEFYDYSMIVGGEEPNERMVKLTKLASQKGYMNILK